MSEAEQRDVVAFLSDPAAHAGATPVETITTHASRIFLAGDHALKLKRAVRYSYLDFSTIELRRAACLEELALNRRTAPLLYLDVLPVTRGADGRLGLGGAGARIDWVLKMKRFSQEALFTHLAETDRLTPDLMRRLADAIAAFHGAAEPLPSAGGVAGIGAVIGINSENLRRDGPPQIGIGEIATLTAACRTAVARSATVLEARRRTGKVRRCHGDLHLGNICLIDGAPTLFDCIEFNPELAAIDVLYDLAFLLMDLRFRGHAAEAAQVFNRYLDVAPESDGLAVMPLFLALRAWVRAHVTATTARSETAADARERAQALARRYFDFAVDLLKPRVPRLVAIGGLSGTGKSTIAAQLAPLLDQAPAARVLRTDVIRKRQFGVAPEQKLPAEAYAPAATEKVYTGMIAEAEAALKAGCSVIMDAVAARPEERAAFADFGRRRGIRFDGFWLEAPQQVLLNRIAGRQGDASDADAAVLEKQLGYDLGSIDWRRIDAAGKAEATVAVIRAALSR